jgi:hypothetical protein
MKCIEVYAQLESLRNGRLSSDAAAIDFLEKHGLVQKIDRQSYEAKKKEIEDMEDYRFLSSEPRAQVALYNSQIVPLRERLESGWHRFWAGRDNIRREMRQLEDLIYQRGIAQKKADEKREQFERMVATLVEIRDYIHVDENQLVKISEAGEKARRRLTVLDLEKSSRVYDELVLDAVERRQAKRKEREHQKYLLMNRGRTRSSSAGSDNFIPGVIAGVILGSVWD